MMLRVAGYELRVVRTIDNPQLATRNSYKHGKETSESFQFLDNYW